jgi:predicted metal-dependent hydrolase
LDKALAVQGAQVAQAAAVDLVVQMVEALLMRMAARAELMAAALEHLTAVMAEQAV